MLLGDPRGVGHAKSASKPKRESRTPRLHAGRATPPNFATDVGTHVRSKIRRRCPPCGQSRGLCPHSVNSILKTAERYPVSQASTWVLVGSYPFEQAASEPRRLANYRVDGMGTETSRLLAGGVIRSNFATDEGTIGIIRFPIVIRECRDRE